jgi:hypothetical protein
MGRRQLVMSLGVLALCGGVLGLWSPTSAVASCAAPRIRVGPASPGTSATDDSPAVMSRREPVTVSGTWFHDGCDDTGTTSGCSGPSPSTPEPPMRAVVLELTQGRSVWTLGIADAAGRDQDFAISWAVRLPADVRPGPAVLKATLSEELEVEIVD